MTFPSFSIRPELQLYIDLFSKAQKKNCRGSFRVGVHWPQRTRRSAPAFPRRWRRLQETTRSSALRWRLEDRLDTTVGNICLYRRPHQVDVCRVLSLFFFHLQIFVPIAKQFCLAMLMPCAMPADVFSVRLSLRRLQTVEDIKYCESPWGFIYC